MCPNYYISTPYRQHVPGRNVSWHQAVWVLHTSLVIILCLQRDSTAMKHALQNAGSPAATRCFVAATTTYPDKHIVIINCQHGSHSMVTIIVTTFPRSSMELGALPIQIKYVISNQYVYICILRMIAIFFSVSWYMSVSCISTKSYQNLHLFHVCCEVANQHDDRYHSGLSWSYFTTRATAWKHEFYGTFNRFKIFQ